MRATILATCALTAVIAAPTYAQEEARSGQAEATPDASQDFGDIVVTARRVEERSQTVPISITAFTQESLRQRGIANGTDLQNFTPSLSVIGHVSRNQETYTVRGMGGVGGAGTGGGPGVVGYFAEVPSTASGPGNFYDLQSLQVLKGPQGTLFGRNTTGGAVLLEPKRPDFDGVSGYAEGVLGSYGRRTGEAALNVPLVDDVLAIRVAGRFDKRDGYVRDALTDRQYLNRNNWSVRGGVQFNPTADISSYTAINYVDVNENGGGNVLLAVRSGSTYATLLGPILNAQKLRGPYEVALSTFTRDIGRQLLILNNTEWWASDNLTIKNVFSYARIRSNTASDGDASPLQISDLAGALPGSYNVNTRRITEELQARYDDGKFSIQGGGFYLHDSTASPLTFQTINPLQVGVVSGGPIILPATPFLLPLRQIQDRADIRGTSKALYAQAGYKPTPELNLTAGFRWTWDTYGGGISQYLDPASFAALPELLGPAGAQLQALGANLCLYDAIQGNFLYFPNCTFPTFGGDSNGATWQLGADWQADNDTLLYAVSRRGYKSGGFNPVVTILSPLAEDDPLFGVRPEKVTDVELGIKRDWQLGNMRARSNLSAFYTWYNDIQVTQRAVFNGADIVTNAESAIVKGIEFEGMIMPIPELVISGTYSFNDAKYTNYQSLPIAPVNGNAGQPSRDLSDTPFVYVPRHKYMVDARLTLPMPNSITTVGVGINWAWQSSQRVAVDPQPFDVIPSYGLLNVRAELNNVGGAPIDLALFGTNVLDEEYRVTANTGYNTSGFNSAIFGERAQYGISARIRF